MANTKPVFTKFSELSKEIQLMIWEAALTSPRVVELCQKPLKKSVGQWNRENCPEGCTQEERAHRLSEDSELGGSRLKRILGLVDGNGREADCSYIFHILGMEASYFPDEDDSEQYRKIEDRLMDFPMPGITTRSPPPRIFFTCRDSYKVASSLYPKMFGTLGTFAETYFNPRQDTLYLRYDTFSYVLPRVFGSAVATLNTITDVESLKSVENVAILLHLEVLEFQSHFRDGVIYYFLDHLLDFFSNLRDATLVLHHYGEYESAEDPCVLLDPFTINGGYRFLRTFSRVTSVENTRIPQYVQVDLARLELRRSQAVKTGRTPYEIPNIHYKVSAPLSFKKAMDAFTSCSGREATIP